MLSAQVGLDVKLRLVGLDGVNTISIRHRPLAIS